ncbi:MAG TPA: hypothetical protein VMW80_11500 [Candidatus Dormibacteraeota bacterium]|nr:hypothetical protein [Candidatus Dormibacteraeota bacterium]
MADSLKERVARALVWTTDQIEPGRGKAQPRVSDMYLGDIQKHLGARIPQGLPRYALRIELAENDPGGPEVDVGKKWSGLFVLTEDAYLLANNLGWGRTQTRGFELADCRAEPVTCTVQGKKTFGFRITGRHRGLIALDHAIPGKGYSQAKIRDRIVSTFNGEEQAGPGQRDTSGMVQTALSRLVSIPATHSEDVRNPPLDADGQLVLADGESLLYRGQHRCEVLRNEPVAYGPAWHKTPAPSGPADVWVTSQRVAISWKDWSSDPSATVMIERRRRAGFPKDEQNSSAVAGHLIGPWISYVFVGRSDSSVEFQALDVDMMVRLRVLGLQPAEAERLMHQAAVAVATCRLASGDSLKPEAESTLRRIADGEPTVGQLDWGLGIEMPASYRIGRDPASLPVDAS